MVLKKYIPFIFFAIYFSPLTYGQIEDNRIQKIQKKLEHLSTSIPGLTKRIDFSLNDTELPIFIRAIAAEQELNISIASDLNQIKVSQNFSNAIVQNVFVYLCKEYHLTLDVFGTIISFKRYTKPFITRDIRAKYDAEKDLFSVDLQNDTLFVAFKKITHVTGKNLVFSPEIENQKISSYS